MLPDKEIEWKEFSRETIAFARQVNKPIFLHIGYIGNIRDREEAFQLFSDSNVAKVLNSYYVPILVDLEEYPEIQLMGIDLLNLNNIHNYNPIHIFALPDFRPISAASYCSADDFIILACNFLEAIFEKHDKLMQLAETTVSIIKKTGIMSRSPRPHLRPAEILEKAVSNWSDRFVDLDQDIKSTPFSLEVSTGSFLTKYASHFNSKKAEKIILPFLDRITNSAAVDPIDGGVFSQLENISCQKPLYEKSLALNIQVASFFAHEYKTNGKERYRLLAEKIIEFMDNEMLSTNGAYISYFTLYTNVDNSIYYSFTLKEIKSLFPDSYEKISASLGMNLSLPQTLQQIPKNSFFAEQLTPQELTILRKRRKDHPGTLKDMRQFTYSNAGVIEALCRVAEISDNKEVLIEKAIKLHALLLDSFHICDYVLSRWFNDGKSEAVKGSLMDYAMFIKATISLFEVTKNREYAKIAENYMEYTLSNFFKTENGMFNFSNSLLDIMDYNKESNLDTTFPCANSVMCDNLLRLATIAGNPKYRIFAHQQLYNIAPHIPDYLKMLGSWAYILLDIVIKDEDSL